jgi:hypothetical protein
MLRYNVAEPDHTPSRCSDDIQGRDKGGVLQVVSDTFLKVINNKV